MTLQTFPNPAVCRTRVIYERRKWSSSPKSLCGLVVEHWSAESSWELRIFSSSHARDKTKEHLSKFLYRAQNFPSFLFFTECFVFEKSRVFSIFPAFVFLQISMNVSIIFRLLCKLAGSCFVCFPLKLCAGKLARGRSERIPPRMFGV